MEPDRIRITPEDVAQVIPPVRPPLPSARPPAPIGRSSSHFGTIALGLGLLGICLPGVIVGPVAAGFGVAALAGITGDEDDRGTRHAAIGIALGFMSFIAWIVAIWMTSHQLPHEPSEPAPVRGTQMGRYLPTEPNEKSIEANEVST